ncbi:MAG TPA: PA2779 family protein [Candidatus Acidoferrum sp.]|nr:PA2779 family protein [Candidatus Acidoferrum sp.]
MSKFVKKLFLPTIAASFIALGAARTANARANDQDHVVSTQELQKDVAAKSKTRRENEARMDRILETPQGREAMSRAGVDYKTVEKGVRMLSDAELAQLTARAQKGQSDFAAGSISELDWILILLVIVLVIVIIAVA